jgi:ferrochelatase
MAKQGLLIINLGSPEAPTAAAVKTYLAEFLTDKYVIDLPTPLRHLLVRGLIAPRRAPQSAEAYSKIWSENGSPLVHNTRQFTAKVARALGSDYDVRWAMRYGQPSIPSQLQNWAVERIFVVPMYPQYAESSTRTAIEEVATSRKNFEVLEDFYARPEFLKAQARRIANARAAFKPDHILLSFHGLPEHHMRKLHPHHCFQTDTCCAQISASNRYCYRAQALATARGLQKELGLNAQNSSVSFQSRLGRRPWIRPYTDVVIEELAQKGVRRVLVSCPSFVADCLETLEEIQMRLREQFQKEGGEELQLAPALNDDDSWVKDFCTMIQDQSLPWRKI